jgi:NCAIR mutase (PurE)-related protein
MDPQRLRQLLEQVQRGERSVDAAMGDLEALPFRELGFATLDHHRHLRHGFPEVVLAEGKTAPQVAEIFRELGQGHGNVLATRASPAQAEATRTLCPDARYDPLGRTLVLEREPVVERGRGTVLVVSAGTSDMGVALEASTTARLMGNRVDQLFDVGVAGLHRLLHQRERLLAATVIIVVAGMEGALPSVVGGLVGKPVIAVPTSVGYGASFRGLAALLGMLNSCAAGVTVVNIDNGFGAGYAAALINRREARTGATGAGAAGGEGAAGGGAGEGAR